MLKEFRCRLNGHGPFYQEQLYENSGTHYNVKLRDKYGRAWGWPICSRCGWMVVTMKWLEDDYPTDILPLEWF